MEHVITILAIIGIATIMYNFIIVVHCLHYKVSVYVNKTLLKPPIIKVGIPINIKGR